MKKDMKAIDRRHVTICMNMVCKALVIMIKNGMIKIINVN